MQKVTLFLLLMSLSVFSQKIHFTGKIVDKETQKPVVYANVSFLKINKGISTTQNGTFDLKIDKKLLNQQIHISCLNYKDTVVFAHQLQKSILFLQPKAVELDEIKISRRVDRELVVDRYRRKHIKGTFGGRKSFPWIVTKFFKYKNEYKNTTYLKEITVYFGALLFRKKSTFRIRLFTIDTLTGKPFKDMLSDNLIVLTKKVNGKIKIDVSKFDVEFPINGFFVGLERLHIPDNFYKETYTMEGSKKKYKTTRVAPSFGAVYMKNIGIWMYSKGKWRKHNFNHSNFFKGNSIVPAISLTLSN